MLAKVFVVSYYKFYTEFTKVHPYQEIVKYAVQNS